MQFKQRLQQQLACTTSGQANDEGGKNSCRFSVT